LGFEAAVREVVGTRTEVRLYHEHDARSALTEVAEIDRFLKTEQ
jgi:hypothetical protein